MSKYSLLSTEISKYRSLLVGGGSIGQVLTQLQIWLHTIPIRGRKKISSAVLLWAGDLKKLLHESIPLGAPVHALLSELQPMIRREERLDSKLKSFEKQYAFQGAMAVIFPWAVIGLSLSFEQNIFSFIGIGLQGVGILFFYLCLKKALQIKYNEVPWLFSFCVKLWMRVSSGAQMLSAIESVLQSVGSDSKKSAQMYDFYWKSWCDAIKTGATSERQIFEWPKCMPKSHELSLVLLAILQMGSPAKDVLKDYTSQLEEERLYLLEDRLSIVPTQLTLVLCIFFTPALFFILVGALWPSLSGLWM